MNDKHTRVALLKEEEAARLCGVCPRKFAKLREAGLVPEPLVLGPRALRWVESELVEALLRLPRAKALPVPPQLARARLARRAGPQPG
jgi:predicted DNA-binding transcriptional regulator AlpA